MSEQAPVRPWPPRPAAVAAAAVIVLLTFTSHEAGVGRPPVQFRSPAGDGMVQIIDIRRTLRLGFVEVVWRIGMRRPIVSLADGDTRTTWNLAPDASGGAELTLRELGGSRTLVLDPASMTRQRIHPVDGLVDAGPFDPATVLPADRGGGIRWPAVALVLVAAVIQAAILASVFQWCAARVDRWRRSRAPAEAPGPRCPSCGYPLLASGSGRCPECGEVVDVDAAERSGGD